MYESVHFFLDEGRPQQVGGSRSIAALVISRCACLGYAGQVDYGIHAPQRCSQSGILSQVALRPFDGWR